MTLLAPSRPSRMPPRLRPLYQRENFDAVLLASATGGGEWESHICFEGVPTGDGREIAPGALKMRPGPTLPLMGLDQRTFGHMLARVCGSMSDAERRDDGVIYGHGHFADTELGQYFEGLVTPDANGVQMMRWVSVDLEVRNYEYVVTGTDDDGWEEYLLRITDAALMGLTLVPFPAFARAIIVPKGADMSMLAEQAALGMEDRDLGGQNPYAGPLTIAASGEPVVHPPAEWFEDPHFSSVTHVRVEEPVNGWRRFSGHLADWLVPHISLNGPIYAPHSTSGYRWFMTKPFTVMGADGPEKIKVGVISVGGGHAPKYNADGSHYGWKLAAEFYDNPMFAGALAVVGEDEHGPWISGAVREGASELQIKMLSHSDVSGDWRGIAGEYELIGIASVNVAGFPTVEQERLIASGYNFSPVDFSAAYAVSDEHPDGELVALVAAGMVRQDPTQMAMQQMQRRIRALEQALEPFRGVAMEYLAGRIGA